MEKTAKFYLFLIFRLSDMMTFGAIEPCTECNGELAAIVFRSGFGYQCMGNIRYVFEFWVKCKKCKA